MPYFMEFEMLTFVVDAMKVSIGILYPNTCHRPPSGVQSKSAPLGLLFIHTTIILKDQGRGLCTQFRCYFSYK